MKAPGQRLSFEGGDSPMAWMFRILPVAIMFFAIVWCMWYVRRANQRARQPVSPTTESTTPQDPVDLEKRRAFIEAKLVTRKVLAANSPDGTISFSDPTVETPTCASAKNDKVHVTFKVNETESTSDSSSEMSLCSEDKEHALPPSNCQQSDAQSLPGLSSDEDEPTSPRDNNILQSSVRSHGSNLRRPSLVRMFASALHLQETEHAPCCDICLMEYDEGDLVCSSPNEACVHVFHKECILDWAIRNPQCPVCRRNYVGEEAV